MSTQLQRSIARAQKKVQYKHTKQLIRSASQFKEDFKDLDSTKYAESMDGRPHYQIKKEYPDAIPARTQVASIYGTHGLQEKNKKQYFNAAHYDLIRAIVPLRTAFRNQFNIAAKQSIAQQELQHWLTYFDRKKEMLQKQPEFWIEDSSVHLLKEAFDRMRNRDTSCVNAPDLIEVHGNFAKAFQFKVPINPRNLSQLIHPHQGYMASMPDRHYTWDEMLQTYEIQMVASHEKSKGRTVHGEELSALSFWLLQDTEKKGSLEIEETSKLLQGLRFEPVEDWKSF